MATLAGFALLLLSLPTILALWHVWDIRGAVPPGGILGELISGGLRTGFNLWGAHLVAVALLVTALFMTRGFLSPGRMPGQTARMGQSGPLRSSAFCRKHRHAGNPGAKNANNSACGAGWKSPAFRAGSLFRRN